jgi:hypothetical protein
VVTTDQTCKLEITGNSYTVLVVKSLTKQLLGRQKQWILEKQTEDGDYSAEAK